VVEKGTEQLPDEEDKYLVDGGKGNKEKKESVDKGNGAQ